MASTIVEALHTTLPLRRCTARLGRNYVAPDDAPVCTAAQLGVAHCPCSGAADRHDYDRAVDRARAALHGDTADIASLLHTQMARLAAEQRFEEAATMRDRIGVLLNATRRAALVGALRGAGRATIRWQDTTWVVDDARLIEAVKDGAVARALPIDPPAGDPERDLLAADQIDEALCLARFFDDHAPELKVDCEGAWEFPIGASADVPTLARAA